MAEIWNTQGIWKTVSQDAKIHPDYTLLWHWTDNLKVGQYSYIKSTLTSRISVRSHLFFFELLETRFCLIWVVTLIFSNDIWKFAQQFIQILSVFHAESPNVRLKIAIFSTITLYLNFKLNVWAKRQTVYPLGHTYLKGHTYYFEGT